MSSPATAESPERRLAESAARDLARREKRTAKALVSAERRTRAHLRGVVQQASERIDAQPTPGEVRKHSPFVHAALATSILESRRRARADARDGLLDEFDRIDGLDVASNDLTSSTPAEREADEAAAFISSSGLTAAWGATALAALAAGRKVARAAAKKIASNVDRTAATETASSFNDARARVLASVAGAPAPSADGGFGRRIGAASVDDDDGLGRILTPGGRNLPRPGMFKVWSAVLDHVTCPRCFAADGEIVAASAEFKAGRIPLHPRCRCLVEFVIIAKTERIEDIAIDYDLFKRELRDLIREERIESQRHAVRFAADSLGGRRSPVVLTRRHAAQR